MTSMPDLPTNSPSTKAVAAVIPAYQAARSVGAVVRGTREILAEVLVIDDGSIDRTTAVARPLSPVVSLVSNLGIGGAVQTGIKYALRNGYDFCIQIDGDGQHIPSEIARLLEEQRATGRNITIGSRYLGNATFRSTFTRRFGSRVIAKALDKLFAGGQITDPTSGMRLMDRRAMALFARRYPQDFPEPISLAWAMRSGLTVGETPVAMRARERGSSSSNGLKPLNYMIRVLSYIVFARLASRI